MRTIKLSTFNKEIWKYKVSYDFIFNKVISNDNGLRYSIKTYKGTPVAYIDLNCKESDLVPFSNPSPIKFFRSDLHEWVEVPFERVILDGHDETWYQKVKVMRALDAFVDSSKSES